MSPDVGVCDCCLLFALTRVSYTETQLLWLSSNYSPLNLTHFHHWDELRSLLCGTFVCKIVTKQVKYISIISQSVKHSCVPHYPHWVVYQIKETAN